MVIRFSALFHNKATLQQYIKHLRWGHRFLRLENTWHTDSVRQVIRGGMKRQGVRPPKVAVDSRQAQGMIQLAVQNGNIETAAMMAIARLFLLRVPSECVPLQWRGPHSSVEVTVDKAIITLSSRKNSRVPVVLTRSFVSYFWP